MLGNQPIDPLIMAGLLLAIFACIPLLAPVRRAFGHAPDLRLDVDEQVVVQIRPDRGVLGLLGVTLSVGLIAFQATLTLLGADPGAALLICSAPASALLAGFFTESRKGWVVTNRRVLTLTGASLPLASVTQLQLAPAMVRIRGADGQALSLWGVRHAPEIAAQIQAISARRAL